MSIINNNICYMPTNKVTQPKKNEEDSKIDKRAIGKYGGAALCVGSLGYSLKNGNKYIKFHNEMGETINMLSQVKNENELSNLKNKLNTLHKKCCSSLNKYLYGLFVATVGMFVMTVSTFKS